MNKNIKKNKSLKGERREEGKEEGRTDIKGNPPSLVVKDILSHRSRAVWLCPAICTWKKA